MCGLALAMDTLAAQAFGAGNYKLVGLLAWYHLFNFNQNFASKVIAKMVPTASPARCPDWSALLLPNGRALLRVFSRSLLMVICIEKCPIAQIPLLVDNLLIYLLHAESRQRVTFRIAGQKTLNFTFFF